MASVRPFHALRYQVERVADPASLLAPPYDVIDAAQQQVLYTRDPYNVIRLEYGMPMPDDTAEYSRYTRAAETLREWLGDGTLTMEAGASFYPHEQHYEWERQRHVRRGFFAAVRLAPFNAGEVLPHEETLKGPKLDRMALMRQCLASFSPVFGLYDGSDSELGELRRRATAGTPLITAEGYEFDDRLWRTDDPELTEAIADGLKNRQILIADGHHRYETMLALRDQLREEFPDAPETAAFNYVLMLLVDLNDPGLLVLPTHRLLLLEPEMKAVFCRVAGHNFTMEKVIPEKPEAVAALLHRHRDEHAFVWYADGTYSLLTSPKTLSDGLPVLDVTALQERIFTPLFALDVDGEASVEQSIRYTQHIGDAVASVDRGEADGAIFLNPTPIRDVLTLAAAGIRLPQKSTYFYPKVPTGLVMHNLRPEVTVG
jgi:uncharacterized protein (DUF1015 family)